MLHNASYNRLPDSLFSLQDKLFKHLKILKWEINSDRQMKNKVYAILWWMGNKRKCHLTVNSLVRRNCHMVWKLCFLSVCDCRDGCRVFAQPLCIWGIEADLVLRFIWDSFLPPFGEGKKGELHHFPSLLAESFGKLTVTLQKFFKRMLLPKNKHGPSLSCIRQ